MTPRLSDLFLRSQSDERLVGLARSGDERAFDAIVERYRPELYALARRISSDGKAEDIVQQTFLSAFVALRSGSEVNHLRGWLYQIARNASARERSPTLAPLDASTSSTETVEDLVEQRALALTALSELSRLPVRQRQAMIDSVLGGRGRAEIAGSMGLSEGAVRQLVHRARTALRTIVTAVAPWPLARWFAAVAPDGSGPVELASGAGAASSAGVAVKVGALVACGTLATGVAVVDLPSKGAHGTAAHAAMGAHPRAQSVGAPVPARDGAMLFAGSGPRASQAAPRDVVLNASLRVTRPDANRTGVEAHARPSVSSSGRSGHGPRSIERPASGRAGADGSPRGARGDGGGDSTAGPGSRRSGSGSDGSRGDGAASLGGGRIDSGSGSGSGDDGGPAPVASAAGAGGADPGPSDGGRSDASLGSDGGGFSGAGSSTDGGSSTGGGSSTDGGWGGGGSGAVSSAAVSPSASSPSAGSPGAGGPSAGGPSAGGPNAGGPNAGADHNSGD
jgi:RNA polymerase sigma factor (sigma-70 family)